MKDKNIANVDDLEYLKKEEWEAEKETEEKKSKKLKEEKETEDNIRVEEDYSIDDFENEYVYD